MSRLKSLWHALNLPCREITRLASESLDRELDGLEHIALKSHLLCCGGCRRYRRQVAFVGEALRRALARLADDDSADGPSLPDDRRLQIKQALKEA